MSIYRVELRSVERSPATVRQFGPGQIRVLSAVGPAQSRFEDSLIAVTILPDGEGFGFELRNKSDRSLRIVWDNASIVDHLGQSGRVMHTGVKFNEAEKTQVPSVVVQRGTLQDRVLPTANVSFSPGVPGRTTGGWQIRKMLPEERFSVASREATLGVLRQAWLGRTVQLLLPVQFEDIAHEYLFVFEIVDIGTERQLPRARPT